MGKLEVILIVIGIFIIFLLVFSAFKFKPEETIAGRAIAEIEEREQIDEKRAEKEKIESKIEDYFSNAIGLHWRHMPLTYSFDNEEDCGNYQAKRIELAFETMEKETEGVIRFRKLEKNERNKDIENNKENETTDIVIYCNKIVFLSEPGFYVAGEAQHFVEENFITYGELYFYNTGKYSYSGGCPSYPNTELHEILHIFGFEHVEERNHIMNPNPTYCPTKLNKDIVEKLTRVYS